MTAFIIRRLPQLLFVLWGAVTLLFFLFFLLPNDPAELIAGGGDKNPDPQVVAEHPREVRPRRADHRPVRQVPRPARHLRLRHVLPRRRAGQRRSSRRRRPASLRLAFWAIVIEAVVGIGAGVLSARCASTPSPTPSPRCWPRSSSAIPVFVLALPDPAGHRRVRLPARLARVGQLPGAGHRARRVVPGRHPASVEQFKYLVQPAIVLASVSTVIVARLARTTMLEVGKMRLHPHRPGQGPHRAARSPASTRCATP